MQTSMQRVATVGVALLVGCISAAALVAVAVRLEAVEAFGSWLMAAASLVLPGLWVRARIEEWREEDQSEAAPYMAALHGLGQAWPLAGEMTINDLVGLAGRIAQSKGWHEQPHLEITSEAAYAQLSALTPVLIGLGNVVEALRRHPGDSPEVSTALMRFNQAADDLIRWRRWMVGAADHFATNLGEYGKVMPGSRTEALAHILLRVSEAAEEAQGVIAGNLPNVLEEMADQWIRHGDTLWGWANVAPPTWADVPNPGALADFETPVREKMLHNMARQRRHASVDAPNGKRA